MDLPGPKCFQSPSLFAHLMEPPLEGNTSFCRNSKDNPFADSFPDPLCKLNLKETSEFVNSFPTSAQRRKEGMNTVTQRRTEAPPTPGRPVFSFSVGNFSKKSFPSKWDDAEKWLNSSSCHDSPAHAIKPFSEPQKLVKQCGEVKQGMEVFAEEEEVTKAVGHYHNSTGASTGDTVFQNVMLKDKFTNEVKPALPSFKYSEPTREGFLFSSSGGGEPMKDAATEVVHGVKHRDMGTEMTPLGSSTTSRNHTPIKSSSPARHNTPADRSGPLASSNSNSAGNSIDIFQLQECHLAKLQLETQFDLAVSNWSSKEEEEEDVSKSLRHFESGNGCRKSLSESRTAAWEEEEKSKFCLRYQREEAKIQAWLNLQNAKAEAQSRKLEVKIQKMRSSLEEKLMKRMAAVHRKAEELRMAAQLQHTQQLQRATQQAHKILNRENSKLTTHSSCSCFPCNNYYN